MSDLTYLLDEICSGMEIYYSGRTGGQYWKTAFVLCDDYTELTSKLFLIRSNAAWSDRAAGGRFKTYHAVVQEVADVWATTGSSAEQDRVRELHGRMKARRTRRNDFFHSTTLLDLSVGARGCVEAFCDLLEYGRLLFGDEWDERLAAARNAETMEILLRLELLGFSDPSIPPAVSEIVASWPRNRQRARASGTHIAEYPEDFHLRMCITWGGDNLRDELKKLL